MRTAFISELINQARKQDSIFLLVADLGFSVVEPFAEEFPNRYLNVGIAEQNMAGIAAGLAFEGYCVFIYSIGNFPTLRCIEQIRNDISYHNLNVKVVSVGGGYSYASLGPSHHTTEELGMLRTIPNMIVTAPGDPLETRSLTQFFCAQKGPCYMRLGKAGEPEVHEPAGNKVSINKPGQIIPVLKGNNIAVLSTGSTLDHCYGFIKKNDLHASLYSFPFIKPLDYAALEIIFNSYKKIITIEEHQLSGGFGSAILEALNDVSFEGKVKQMPIVKRIGINNEFISCAGTQAYLRQQAGVQLEQEYFL